VSNVAGSPEGNFVSVVPSVLYWMNREVLARGKFTVACANALTASALISVVTSIFFIWFSCMLGI